MYKTQNMPEEMLRVAKSLGGLGAYKQVAYLYAISLGPEGCIKLLEKLSMSRAPLLSAPSCLGCRLS